MGVVSIFISNPAGRAYLSPPIATPAVMGTFSFNMVLNLAWIFVWDRSSVEGYDGLVILAFFILVSIAVSNIAVMALMARNITKYAAEFARGTPLFWCGLEWPWDIHNLDCHCKPYQLHHCSRLPRGLGHGGFLYRLPHSPCHLPRHLVRP